MKDKVLFAKTSITKFMALLVTLLTMFASCNFLGGEDMRTPTAGSNDPGKYNGTFKSVITGVGVQIYPATGDSFEFDNKMNMIEKRGLSGSFGSWDKDGIKATGKYDVSNIAYVIFDLKANSKGTLTVSLFGDSENATTVTIERDGDSEAEMTVVKDNRIDVKKQKEYTVSLFTFAGTGFDPDSKVKIENFTFYDENGKEVVPKYIKYTGEESDDEGGVPGQDGGEEGAFRGFFKGSIQGSLDIEIWAAGETFGFDAPTITVLAPDGWWGGAIYLKDKNEKYKVNNIVSVSFDIVADNSGKMYVNVFQKESNGANAEYKKDLDLVANVHQNVKIGSFPALTEKVDRLVAFGGDSNNLKGAKVTITNFAFYDAAGNEVVPELIK